MEKFTKLNEIFDKIAKDIEDNAEDKDAGSPFRSNPELAISMGEETAEPDVKFIDDEGIQISEPCKFVSKIFESRQMAHVYHLQARGESSYAKHMALDIYYKEIQEILDKFIEVYSGQYEIIENYEVIKTENRQEEPIQYFFEVVEFINSTKKLAFIETDTHLFNTIDEMVSLIYRTIYRLKLK